MAAPEGNEFWKKRSTHGRNPIFESPEDLEDACYQYIQWCEENPLKEQRAALYQGVWSKTSIDKMRAMTVGGLCLFLGVTEDTWNNYRNRKGFLGITKEVDAVIRNQKFTGAAADLLNPNIIARDLGLVDKKETDHKGSMDTVVMTSDERDARIAELKAKA